MVEQRQLSLLDPDEGVATQKTAVAYRDHLVFKEPDAHKLYMGMQHLSMFTFFKGALVTLFI